MEKWGVKLDVCTQPPYPQVGAGDQTPALPDWFACRVRTRRLMIERPSWSRETRPLRDALIRHRIAHNAPGERRATELPSECQMACTMPALRFRVRFDIDDRSQRSSNS